MPASDDKVTPAQAVMAAGGFGGTVAGAISSGAIATACLAVPIVGPLLGLAAIFGAPAIGGALGVLAGGAASEALDLK